MQQHSLLHILSPQAKIAYLLSLSLGHGKDFIFRFFILPYQMSEYHGIRIDFIMQYMNSFWSISTRFILKKKTIRLSKYIIGIQY